MEHLNKIELVGTLWSITVQDYDTTKAGKLIIVTECEYFAQDGCKTIETTWHHVTAWESETGESVTVNDIIATKVETL